MYTKTSNLSFKKMREFLQSKGIENNEFMLQVNNPNLKNFNLSDVLNETNQNRNELILDITEECNSNVWFFFREILPAFANDMDSFLYDLSEKEKFHLSLISMIMIYLYSKNRNFAVQRFYYDDAEDPEVTTVVLQTLSMLALYEYIFKQNNPGKLIIAKSDSEKIIWDYIYKKYQDITYIASKGLILHDNFFTNISSSIRLNYISDTIKFYHIALEKNRYAVSYLSRIKESKVPFYGMIDHIRNFDKMILDKEKLQTGGLFLYFDDMEHIAYQFISSIFTFDVIDPSYRLSKPRTIYDKYKLDYIFDSNYNEVEPDKIIVL